MTRLQSFKGTTSLVTGASMGLGAEIARQLAARGAGRALDALTTQRPDATVSLVPGGGTYCMIEEPRSAAEAIHAFMDDLT